MEFSHARYIYTNSTAQTIGARAQQQDVVDTVIIERGNESVLLALLADGMGGMAHGERFSRLAVDVMSRGFQTAVLPSPCPGELLMKLAFQANKEAYALQEEGDEGGSTLLAVLIQQGQMTFLTIGDSRIDLYRNGHLIQLNRQHTLGALLDERACIGLLSEEDARNVNCRHALSSFVGAETIKRMDLNGSPIQLLAGDRVILMSDGVFDALSDIEIVQAIQQPASANEYAEVMIASIKEKRRPKQDNASVSVIAIQ